MISTKIIRFANINKCLTFEPANKTNPGLNGITTTMKTLAQQFRNALLVSLLTVASGINAQSIDTEPGDPVAKERSFDIGMYIGAQRKINLMLNVNRPERIIITMRDANNTVLYREYLKKGPAKYWRKFDFEGSESGVYEFEVRTGRQTIKRRVEVVDIPAIEPQRYITYGPQISQ